MNKRVYVLGLAALFALSGVAAVVGCGSDSNPVGTFEPDASSSIPNPNPTGTGTGSPPGTNDAGDGGNPTPDSGPNNAAGAGKIVCGSTECTTATDVCCTTIAIDGGTTPTCQAESAACNAGIKTQCDETADCTAGKVCCTPAVAAGSSCADSCAVGNVQLCRLDTECGDGGACKDYSCPVNRTVRACEKPIGCN